MLDAELIGEYLTKIDEMINRQIYVIKTGLRLAADVEKVTALLDHFGHQKKHRS